MPSQIARQQNISSLFRFGTHQVGSRSQRAGASMLEELCAASQNALQVRNGAQKNAHSPIAKSQL
jgi:hypothetical protein